MIFTEAEAILASRLSFNSIRLGLEKIFCFLQLPDQLFDFRNRCSNLPTLTRAFLYLLPGRSRALERGAAPIGEWHLAGGAPLRLMLIVVTVAVAMLLDLRVSQATQMPWCAGTSKGDFFSYNCTLPTYEMCVQEVIAGNRGFCSPNPNYRGPEFVPPRAKRKRHYY